MLVPFLLTRPAAGNAPQRNDTAAALRRGNVLTVRVLETAGPHRALLQIGATIVLARTHGPLQAGREMKMRVTFTNKVCIPLSRIRDKI
jgi:hypothetical protein